MVEFEDAAAERMAQLEQEDLELYQRGRLGNSSYSYHNETPDHGDEFQSKLPVLLDMVRGIIDGLKQYTSSIENGSDEVTSCNNSDEHLSDEEFVDNELPEAVEMLDFGDIKSNDSPYSNEMPKFAEAVVSESGLMVLSIYCAHMAPKWRHVLDSQPIQGNEMSVVVYYDRFCDWKKKLDEVDYIGGEESYIDDFLYGLKRELAVRIWKYKWKPQTLYGAFRRAIIEENVIKNDAVIVLEEMPHSNSIDNQGVGDVSYGYGNISLDAALGSEFTIKVSLIEEDNEHCQLLLQKDVEQNKGMLVDGGIVASLFDLQVSLSPLVDLTVNGLDNGSTKSWHDEATLTIKIVIGKYAIVFVDDAYKEFGEMTQAIRAALLDEEVINHSAKYADFIKLLLFDPGGDRKYAYGISEGNFCNTIKWDNVMFIFNIGGGCWLYKVCELFEFDHCCLVSRVSLHTIDVTNALSFVLVFIETEVYFVCSTSDQTAPRLRNGHDMVLEMPNIYFTAADMLSQKDPFEDEHFLTDFSLFCIFKSDSHAISPLKSSSIAHGDNFSKSLFAEANSKSLSKWSCYCMLSLDRLTNELGFMSSFESRISLLPPLRVNYIWDPGLDAIFFYIIEDNDVLKRMGIGTRVALKQEEWMDRVSANYIAYELIWKKFIDVVLVILRFLVYTAAIEYVVLMKWSSVEPHASFCSNILKGFVWDPGTDFIMNCGRYITKSSAAFGNYLDTMPLFVSKAIGCGAPSLELRGALIIVPCVKRNVHWYDYFVHVCSCNPYNIETVQDSFPSLQMCMTKDKERNMLQAISEDILITNAAMNRILSWPCSMLNVLLILCGNIITEGKMQGIEIHMKPWLGFVFRPP